MKNKTNSRPFNSPLESGLRMLIILDKIKAQGADLQRLVYYDYLLVHSGDVDGGPESLHTAIPFRSGEWLVRRDVIQKGIELMYSKELLDKYHTENGIVYRSTKLTRPFLGHFESAYFKKMRTVAGWLSKSFDNFTNAQLSKFMVDNIGRWGAEFKYEALFK